MRYHSQADFFEIYHTITLKPSIRSRYLPVCLNLIILLVICSTHKLSYAQTTGLVDEKFISIQQNSTSILEAFGDTLWTGPGLNRLIGNEEEWYVPLDADSLFTGRGRVFSLSLSRDKVIAGLGYTDRSGEDDIPAAMGYYKSIDRGESWKFIPFPLDPDPDDEECGQQQTEYKPGCDLTFTYGENTYNRLRITVPQQSPPYEVDFHNNTILSVNWASGLLRSIDGGSSWEKLILPPSTETSLTPGREYNWISQTANGDQINRYDPRFDNNLLGFGLLIDSNQRVWVGTASGINLSENALTAPADQISWNRVSFSESGEGLLGGWIVKIREEPGTGRIWMTNWPSDPQHRDTYGLVSSDDAGKTFDHHLEGIRLNDIGFHNGVIFATGDDGLYISGDSGETWNFSDQIRSPNTYIREDARYFAAAATSERIWIGTEDGLASSGDGGQNWQITRVDFPLRGGNVYQQNAPDVDTYAYPNPFSPSRHNVLRIRYEVRSQNRVRIRIFDFGMNLIRNLENQTLSSGTYETSWDGFDETGQRIANGPVFYIIEEGNRKTSGKILLLD